MSAESIPNLLSETAMQEWLAAGGFNSAQFKHSIGDDGLMRELGAIFQEDMPRLLRLAHEALGRGDMDTLADVAHSLKGMLGNYASTSTYNLAESLNDAATAGDLSASQAYLIQLDAQLGSLSQALNQFFSQI